MGSDFPSFASYSMYAVFKLAATWTVFGFFGGFVAARKGYPPTMGILIGVFLGPLGLLVALILPRTLEGQEQRHREKLMDAKVKAARVQKSCPECGTEHSSNQRFCPSCMYRYPA